MDQSDTTTSPWIPNTFNLKKSPVPSQGVVVVASYIHGAGRIRAVRWTTTPKKDYVNYA